MPRKAYRLDEGLVGGWMGWRKRYSNRNEEGRRRRSGWVKERKEGQCGRKKEGKDAWMGPYHINESRSSYRVCALFCFFFLLIPPPPLLLFSLFLFLPPRLRVQLLPSSFSSWLLLLWKDECRCGCHCLGPMGGWVGGLGEWMGGKVFRLRVDRKKFCVGECTAGCGWRVGGWVGDGTLMAGTLASLGPSVSTTSRAYSFPRCLKWMVVWVGGWLSWVFSCILWMGR